MSPGFHPPETVLGVDFSSVGRHGGSKLWVSKGAVDGDAFEIEDCFPVVTVVESNRDQTGVLRALTRLISRQSETAAVGLDFPFGLPEDVMSEPTWEAFVHRFPDWYESPSELARRCRERARLAGYDEPVYRATERRLSTVTPYGDRLRAKTFFGIRDVLRPLVLTDSARALPVQSFSPDRPSLLEVFPAATLENAGRKTDESVVHWQGYAGEGEQLQRRRTENLDTLTRGAVTVTDEVRAAVERDEAGDALDSIVAAIAAYRHTLDGTDLRIDDDTVQREGYIYV